MNWNVSEVLNAKYQQVLECPCASLTLTKYIVAVDANNQLTTFVAPDRNVNVNSDELVARITDVCEPTERTSTQLTQLYLLHYIIVIVVTSTSSAATTNVWPRPTASNQRLHNPLFTRATALTASVCWKLAVCSEIILGCSVDNEILSLWLRRTGRTRSTTSWNTVMQSCNWHAATCRLFHQQLTSHFVQIITTRYSPI